MSGTAAVMLVKDEADVIEFTLRHLHREVDFVIAADNGSTDGTREILARLACEHDTWSDPWLVVSDDPEAGYYQGRKTTALAHDAYERGFDWVIPVDADEYWYSPHGRIRDVLSELPEEVLFARAMMLNHLATGVDDPSIANPFLRLGWRLLDQGAMAKIACRTNPALRIDMGNHDATSVGRVRSGWVSTVYEQLWIHHYPWRSAEQFVKKITNGARAYAAAPDLDPTYGEHWKAYGLPGDEGFEERVVDWFWKWGYRADPLEEGHEGGPLFYDPPPGTFRP